VFIYVKNKHKPLGNKIRLNYRLLHFQNAVQIIRPLLIELQKGLK